MAESIQHKISRVRPPRVQITYDVEIGDAIQKKELPFVIGVIADLSKQRGVKEPTEEEIDGEVAKKLPKRLEGLRRDKMSDEEWAKAEARAKAELTEEAKRRGAGLERLADRAFVEIDRDNFNDVLGEAAPRVAFTVKNLMEPSEEDPGDIAIALTISSFDEFEPIKLIEKIPEINELLAARNKLRDFLLKLDGNSALNSTLTAAINDGKLETVLEEIKKKAPESVSTEDEVETT